MQDRIRFINHGKKKILLVDFSNCPANEVEEIARAVPDYVTVDRDALRAMKETAVFDKPYVKKSALIGTESLPRDFYCGEIVKDTLQSFGSL